MVLGIAAGGEIAMPNPQAISRGLYLHHECKHIHVNIYMFGWEYWQEEEE